MIPGNANPLLLASAAADAAAAGPIKSVRFNSGDSAYLNRTPSSTGNRRTFTFAFWIKKDTTSTAKRIFNCGPYTPGTGYRSFNIISNGGTFDPFYMWDYSSSYQINLVADAAHRDASAWYHLVWAVDTTQATESDRVKLYINGTQFTNWQTGGAGAVYPAQNYDTSLGLAEEMIIGTRESKNSEFLDGYLADFYYIDGSALDATSFGAFDDSGVWQAAAYSGTFGTNGFHLFDFANESGIGDDSSGNDNDFTVNNISLPDAGTPVSSATGAKPIFATTDSFGQTVGTGLATDSDASDLELCAPLTDGSGAASMTDRSPTGRTSSALTLTNNSSSDITVSTSTGNFYGESLNFSGSHSGVDVAGIGIWNSNFTLEGWFRRTSTGALQTLFDTWYGQTSGVGFYVWWDGTNIDVVKDGSTYYNNGSGTTLPLNTWQHIALTRNGTTIKIYVDGTEYSSFTPSDSTWTSTKLRIGDAVSNGYPFLGQIQDVRAYSGLKYTGNFTVPAKPATSANDDVLFDVPTNGTQSDTGAGGEVSGNYCTWNPLQNFLTLSNGNLDVVQSSQGHHSTYATLGVSSGKWYFEITKNDDTYSSNTSLAFGMVGVEDTGIDNSGSYSAPTAHTGYLQYGVKLYDGQTYPGNITSNSSTIHNAGVFMFAYDFDNGKGWIGKDGVWFKPSTASGGDPANGTNPCFDNFVTGKTYVPMLHMYPANASVSANFGQRPFAYSAPTGFKALCTTNLPTPTVADGSDHFEALAWQGNGDGSGSGTAAARDITGASFKPSFAWVKTRSPVGYVHQLTDAVRGLGSDKSLRTTTDAEGTDSSGGYIDAFLTNGISTVVSGTDNDYYNRASTNYIGWLWNAGANSSKTYTVKVVSDSGNKYRFDDFGTSAVTLDLEEGSTYVFDQSDSSNSGHPLRFSTTSDGTHGSGSEYTTGVTTTGTPGSAGAKTTIVVAASAPTLYYYCSAHSGMGGQANTNSTAGASNFDGTIQSTVRANQAAGFSIVSYTGNNTNGATLGHGLNATPSWIIIKNRSTAYNWIVLYTDTSKKLYLDLVNTPDSYSQTTRSSSIFTLENGTAVNGDGNDMIAYCFASVEGYSLLSSYQANGSDDGTFVFCGFRPKFIIIRGVGYSTDWLMVDTSRDPDNPATEPLFPNRSYYEGQASTSFKVDILSNGFKLRHADSSAEGYNYVTNPTHIFYAVAENPFQANGGLAR